MLRVDMEVCIATIAWALLEPSHRIHVLLTYTCTHTNLYTYTYTYRYIYVHTYI